MKLFAKIINNNFVSFDWVVQILRPCNVYTDALAVTVIVYRINYSKFKSLFTNICTLIKHIKY